MVRRVTVVDMVDLLLVGAPTGRTRGRFFCRNRFGHARRPLRCVWQVLGPPCRAVEGAKGCAEPPSPVKPSRFNSPLGCPMTRKFHVGQTVTLTPAASRNVPGGAYEVTKCLPDDGGEPRYQIKSANEPHERVALEGE